MKWVAVLLVVALVAIDGLTALNLHAPLGTSKDSGKQRSRSAVGLDVGVSKEDGLKLTKTESEEQHSGASNQQNSKKRTASQDGNSQTDLERHRSEDTETNNARQDSQSLSLAGQNDLLQSKQTTRRNGDTTTNTQDTERVHSTSHDQNGGNSRDVNSLNERGNNHQTQTTYDEQSSSGFGLGNGGLTSSRTGSRSATNSDTDKGFNRNQRTEEETSQQGGTVVHRKTQSGSNEENEQFQQTSSQSGYSDHGQGNRGGGQQGLLNTANHDKPGQYKFKRTVPIGHKPISHIPSHGTFEKFDNHQNGNVGSQTGNHGDFNRPIGHLSSHSGGHINGAWNQGQNIEQLLRGAGNQRRNHIVSGSGIKYQGANSADYVNQNDETDTLKHLTGSEYPGIDLNQDLTEVHNQGRNKVHFVSGSEYQGSDVNEGFNRALTDNLNTANFGSGSENLGMNSGEYVSGIIADDSGYESVNDDLGQVVNREIHSNQFISGTDNQGPNAGRYANKIGAHDNGYQRTDEPGSLSEILRRRLNKPHYISGSGNQGINSGKYVNGIFTPNDKYISGNGYRSNSNEYLNGLLHRGRVNYHPVKASQANVAGKYINRDFGQEGVNTDQYAFVDENEDVNSQYISDILTQAQRLLKHGTVPNGFGTTPIHYRPISSNRGPVYRTPNSGRRFYDQGIGSYMANPSSAADDDSSYGEDAPEYVIPTGISQGFNSYPNGHIIRPSYYRNDGFGTGLGYLPGPDGTAPTTIFGRSPGFSHVSPVSTVPVSHVANEDNAGVLVDKTLTFAPLRPLTPLSPLSPLTPLTPNDNDYEGTSGNAADIIIDTELLSRRNTKAPGTDGLVKKVGITTVINQDFTDKNIHASHVDSNNSGTSRNINEAVIDKTVLVKHTNKNGQDNGKIDNASTKTTTIIGNNDGSVVSGNGPSKPGKSIVIDKTPVFNKSDKDGKFNDNNDKAVDNKQKSLGKDVSSVVTVKDNEGITKNDQSIVIDKITGIIKSVKDGKDKGKKDKTVMNIEKFLGTDVKSGPIDNKDNKPTTNGKSIVTDKTTVSNKTDFDGKDDVSDKKYKDVDNTTKPVTSVVIEKTTVINKPLEKDGASDSNGNTVTTVPSKSSVDKSTDKNSKDKSLENIKTDGSDKKDKDIDSYTKRVQTIVIEKTINKILGKVGGSDINNNTVTTATKISSGDKTTDKIPKDDNKKDTTVEKITKVLGKDDEFENNGKHVKPIIIEKTAVNHKILDKDGGSDTNGYKKIIGTDKSLEDKTSISKDDDEKDKTVKKITKVLGKDDRSVKNDKYVYDTTKPVKSIVNVKTSVINQILGKDGESNTNTKLTKLTDKSSEDKYTNKISKDDKKDKTVEKITKVLGKDDRIVNNGKHVDKTMKPVEPIIIEKVTVINKNLGEGDGSDTTGYKKTVGTNKSSEDKTTDKTSKHDKKKDKTIEKIRNGLGKDDRSNNKDKDFDSTKKPVKSVVTEKTSVTNKNLGKDVQSDKNYKKETIVIEKSLGDKNTDKNSKDDTIEKIKRGLVKGGGSHNNDKDVDSTKKPSKSVVTEKTSVTNKNLGKDVQSDKNYKKETIVIEKSLGDKNTDKNSKDDTIEKIKRGLVKGGGSHNNDKDVDSTKKSSKSVVTEKTPVTDKNLGKDVESDKNDKKETIVTDKSLGDKNTDKNLKHDTIEKINKSSSSDDGLEDTDDDDDNYDGGDDDNNAEAVKSIGIEETTWNKKDLGKDYGSDSSENKKITVTNTASSSINNSVKENNKKNETVKKSEMNVENDENANDDEDNDDDDDVGIDESGQPKVSNKPVTNTKRDGSNEEDKSVDKNKQPQNINGDESNGGNKDESENGDGSGNDDWDDDDVAPVKSGEERKSGTYVGKEGRYSTKTDKVLGQKGQKNDHVTNSKVSGNDGASKDDKLTVSNKTGQDDSNNGKNEVSNSDDDSSFEYCDDDEEYPSSKPGRKGDENTTVKSDKDIKFTTDGGNTQKDHTEIGKVAGRKTQENDHGTNSKDNRNDGVSKDDKLTVIKKKRGSDKAGQVDNNDRKKDESNNDDNTSNEDSDADEDYLSSKQGKEGDDNTTVKSDKDIKSRTDSGDKQKDLTKIGKVAGQKNDHGTYSKESGNDRASKDTKVTDIKKKRGSNKTGQNDSNDGKKDESNRNDDSSTGYRDHDDDEDYLSGKPGKKGDANTTVKSDKDIKSRTDGGDKQKDIKIGKVAGQKTQKNDHGTDSKESGNDGVSKDDKLTDIKKKHDSNKTGHYDSNDGKKDKSNRDDDSSNGDHDDDEDEDYLSGKPGRKGDANTTVKSDKDIKSRTNGGDKQNDLIKIGKVAGQNDHGTYSKESGNDRPSKDTKVTDIKKKRGSNKTGHYDSNDGKAEESNRNDDSSNGDRDDDDNEDYLSGKPGRKGDANTTVKSNKDIKSRTDGGDKQKDIKIGKVTGQKTQKHDHGTDSKESGNDRASKDTKVTDIKKKHGSNKTGQNDSNDGKKDESNRNDDSSNDDCDDDEDEDYLSGKPGKKGDANATVKPDKDIKSRTDGGDKQKDLTKIGKVAGQKNDHGTYSKESGNDRASKDTKVTDIKKKRGSNKTGQNDSNDGEKDESNRNDHSSTGYRDHDDDEDYLSGKPGKQGDANTTVKPDKDIKSRTDGGDKQKDIKIGKVAGQKTQKNDHGIDSKESGNDGVSKDDKLTDIKKKHDSNKTGHYDSNDGKKDKSNRDDDSSNGDHDDDEDEDYLSGKPGRKGDANTTVKSDKDIKSRTNGGDKQNDLIKIGKVAGQNDHGTYSKESGNDRPSKDTKVTDIKKKRGSNKTGHYDSNDGKAEESNRNDDSSNGDRDDDDNEDYLSGKPGRKGDANTTVKSNKDIKSRTDGGDKQKDIKIGKVTGQKTQKHDHGTDSKESGNDRASKDTKVTDIKKKHGSNKTGQNDSNDGKKDESNRNDDSSNDDCDDDEDEDYLSGKPGKKGDANATVKPDKDIKSRTDGGDKQKDLTKIGKVAGQKNDHGTYSKESGNDRASKDTKVTDIKKKRGSNKTGQNDSNDGEKDESNRNDHSSTGYRDHDDDEDYLSGKPGKQGDANTTVKPDKDIKSRTDGGDKQKDIKIGKVAGQKTQKNDHGIDSKESGNDGVSKDDKLTDIKKKHDSNKTGHYDSNDGKKDKSNRDDDSSNGDHDDDEDEDYLSGKPGRKGDANTTVKSDKDIKSRTNGGDKQNDLIKIGKVAGQNDHGTYSKESGNDRPSKDTKVTDIKKKRGSNKTGHYDSNDGKAEESNRNDDSSNGDRDDDDNEDYLSGKPGRKGDANTTVKSNKDIKSRTDGGDKQKDIKIGKVTGQKTQKHDHGTDSKESGNDRASKDTKVTDIKKKHSSNKTGQNDSNDGKKDESNRNDDSSNEDCDDDEDEDYLSGKPGKKGDANATVKPDKDIKSRTDGGDKQKDLTKIGKVAGQKNDHGTYSKESGNDRASKDTKVTDIKKKRGSNKTGQNDSNDGEKDESNRNDHSSTGYRDHDDDEDYLSGKPGKQGDANTTVKPDKDIKSRTDGGDKQKDIKIGKVAGQKTQKNGHGTDSKESGNDRASKDTKVTDIKKKRGSNKTGQNDSNDGKKDESNRNDDSSNEDCDDDEYEDYLSGKTGKKGDANTTVKPDKDIKSRTDGGDKQKDLTKIGKVAGQKNDHGTDSKESGNDRASKDTKETDIKKKRGSNKTGQNDSNDGEKDESNRNDHSSTGYRDHDDDEDYLSGKPGKQGDANTTVKPDKDIKSRTDGGDKQKDIKIGKVAGQKTQKNGHGIDSKETGNDRASKDTKVTDIKKKRGSNKTGQNDSNDGKKDESNRNDDSSTGYRDHDDDEDYLSGKPGKKGDANTTVKSDKDIKSRTDGGDKQKDIKIGKVAGQKTQKNDHGTDSKESGNDEASKDTKVTDIKKKRGSNKTGQNDSNDGKKDESNRNDDSSNEDCDDDEDEDYLSGKPGKKGDANATVKPDKDIKSRTDGGDKQKDLTKIGKVAGQKNDHGTYSKESGNDRASKDTKVTDIKKKRGSNKTGQNDSNDGEKDESNRNDHSSTGYRDHDDDEDYLSGKPGKQGDANTTVKPDKDIKSRTDGGDKQKDLTKIGKVAGQKNDHGTYSKESGNDRASKDTKVTDIKKKRGSNKTGQNDSNDGKADESNRNDDSSTGYRDHDDDEDYLSGKPGKKGDANTTVKSDKDIKSRTDGGDKQKDIKIGKVAGQKTQKNDHGTDSKESGNDEASKDTKVTDIKKKRGSNKTGQNDSNDGKADESNRNDDSSNADRDDDDNGDYLSGKPGRKGDANTTVKSNKDNKSRTDGGDKQKDIKIGKVSGRKTQKNDHGTNSKESGNDEVSKDDKLTIIKKKRGSNKAGQVDNHDCKKDESNSNNDSSNEDCDDDEDYLSSEQGKEGDDNTTVKSDKDIKSRTGGGDKQKDLTKIGKVAGQKNDHGTYPKESRNDDRLTDIKKKRGYNKTGQNDSNDGKKDESNRNDDSSNADRDDDDDEDYLSGKPGKKGDANTTVKSDKDIKSRTNAGDKQKDIKIGKVSGRKTKKNDHGTNSKESGNDGVSKDDKLTIIKKKRGSNKTGQNDNNDGKADGSNSNDDSSNGDRDDDDNEYDLSDKSGKGEKSGEIDASKNSSKGSKSGRNGHKVLSKIVKVVGRKQQKNDQKTNSYINETDGESRVSNKEAVSSKTDEESRVINKEVVSSKTDEVESADVKKVETIRQIKKEVASDNDDNYSNNDRDVDNDDSYDNFGNSAKKDKKAVGSDSRDGTNNQATDNSGKVDKSGSNDEKKDATVTNTNTGGSIRHTNETFKTKNRRTINKVGKKDIKKSKKHLKSRHASDSSLEVSHDNNGKNSKDDINTTTRHEHDIRIKTVKSLQEKEHKNGDDNSADNKNVGTTSTSTNSKKTITKIPNTSKNNSNTSIKNGDHSGRDDISNKDDNSAVNNEKSKSNRHANAKGNKNKSSKITRKHTATSNNEESTDTNISEDKTHTEKHMSSGSKNKPTDDNDSYNESDKHSKHDSTKKSNTDQTIHGLGQKDTASVTDDADSNKSGIGTTSTTETITTSRLTDNAHKNTKSKKRSKTTTDSRESSRTDDGKHQDKNNGGTANDDGSENCGERKPGGSSTNEKETGTQPNDKTKRNASKKREEQSSQSGSGNGSGSEEDSLKKKGDKSTYNKKSDDNEHSAQQKDSKFTEVSQDSKGKTVQTGQKSASEKDNQRSSDNYTEETDGKNKKSKKESSSSEDKAKKEAASGGSERVYSNGNTGRNKSSSRNKSIKSMNSSFTDEKSSRTS